MLLTVFVVAQLVFDVALLLLFVVTLLRRRAEPVPDPEPPAWYGEVVLFAQDLLAATEPLLDALELRRAQPEPDEATGREGRHREAMALLRAGVDADEVGRRGRLLPGELRLIRNVVAAETRSASSPGA